MTRRMQANERYSHLDGVHGREHDEDAFCTLDVPCEPVPAEPGVSVVVPRTGTVVVADGVVYKSVGAVARSWCPNRLEWQIATERPKPTFFEAGKTYRREYEAGRYQTFDVATVKEESGDRVAFGRLVTDGYGADWVIRRQHHWDADFGWKEAGL